MPETTIARTADETWRVDLVAFQSNLVWSKAVGATIRAYHWEVGGILWWRKERWVEQPVEYLSVRVSYEGGFVGEGPGRAVRGHSVTDASACDERLFAFGGSLTWKASGPSGGPAGGPGPPGPTAILDVRGVRAIGSAVINREPLALPEASTGITHTAGPF